MKATCYLLLGLCLAAPAFAADIDEGQIYPDRALVTTESQPPSCVTFTVPAGVTPRDFKLQSALQR